MASNTIWGELILIGLAVVASGIFEGAEVALLASQKRRLEEWEKAGRRGAAAALLIRETPERFLTTIQIAMMFAIMLAAVVAGDVAVHDVAPWLLGRWPFLASWGDMLALALMIVVLTYTGLIFGQLLPKAIALQHPERVLCWLARPIIVLTQASTAVRGILTASLTVVLWVLRQRRPPESASITAITEEAVTAMVREGAERGIFEEVEHELIEGVFEFTDTAVREIMVPRVRIQALEVTTPAPEVIRKVSEIGHSRVPVYNGDLDHIVGILYLKDVLRAMSESRSWTLSSLLHPPLFVPEMVQISRLLRTLQQQHMSMAIVIDEHGGVSGLVTIEDLLEQLVGEISDEGAFEAGAQVIRLADGSLVVQGSVPLWELRERFELPLEESPDYQTIAGLVLSRLGRIPQGGESIVVQGYRLTVVDMDGPRIARIKIEPLPPEELKEEPVVIQETRRQEQPEGGV